MLDAIKRRWSAAGSEMLLDEAKDVALRCANLPSPHPDLINAVKEYTVRFEAMAGEVDRLPAHERMDLAKKFRAQAKAEKWASEPTWLALLLLAITIEGHAASNETGALAAGMALMCIDEILDNGDLSALAAAIVLEREIAQLPPDPPPPSPASVIADSVLKR